MSDGGMGNVKFNTDAYIKPPGTYLRLTAGCPLCDPLSLPTLQTSILCILGMRYYCDLVANTTFN